MERAAIVPATQRLRARFPDVDFTAARVPENGSEVRLVGDFSESLSSWEEIVAFLQGHLVVWMPDEGTFLTTNYAVVRAVTVGEVGGATVVKFSLESERHHSFHSRVYVVSLVGENEPVAVYEKLARVAAEEPASVYISGLSSLVLFPMTAGVLERVLLLMSNSRVHFEFAEFSEDQCRALSTFRRSLTLEEIWFAGGGRGLFEAIGDSHGPEELDLLNCNDYDVVSLHQALSSTTSLRRFMFWDERGEYESHSAQVLHALGRNRSLVEVCCDLRPTQSTDEAWIAGFASLGAHPTLKKLEIDHWAETAWAPVVFARGIADMLRTNTVLCEITPGTPGSDDEIDEGIFEREIKPRLKANKYRPLFQALAAEESDRALRLFHRALLHPEINGDPSMIRMMLAEMEPHGHLLELGRAALGWL